MTGRSNHDTTKKLQLAMIVFDETISREELRLFRGVMIGLSGDNHLFHNHVGEGYRYAYPKIQYKLIDGHPAILGINEGVTALKEIIDDRMTIHCRLGRRLTKLTVDSVDEWEEETGVSGINYNYRIEDWLPLNERNFIEFRQAEGLIERLTILQNILTGNILSFAKGMEIYFDSKVNCRLESVVCNGTPSFKGVGLMSFSVAFSANVSLPQFIGLGKSASMNHGIIIKT